MLFYIIFGTNLLTQSPVPVPVFPLFQCFKKKEYQTESKRDETFGSDLFGTNVIQGQQGTYCIVSIEDKKMGFISYCMSLSLYIMSSCLMRYSVLYELNTLDAC